MRFTAGGGDEQYAWAWEAALVTGNRELGSRNRAASILWPCPSLEEARSVPSIAQPVISPPIFGVW